MKHILTSLSVLLAVGAMAQAQTVKRSYTTTDGYGNSTTTTIEAPASVAGFIAGQTIYGGFPNYAGGVPSYANSNCPVPNYGYNGGYGYNSNGYGYNNGYGNYAGYGYPAPAPYAYPPQAYYIPGQTTYLPGAVGSPFPPPAITTLPQVINNSGLPLYPYGTYGYPGYGYGQTSRTTVANGAVNYARNGVSVSIGGSTTTTRIR